MGAFRTRTLAWKSLVFGTTLGALLPLSAEAAAKECPSPLVNTCINSDTLWPNAGPMRFIGVGGTETVAKGDVGFGLITTYLSQPILLHVASPGASGSNQAVVDDQVNGNFLFAYGVTDRLQLDFALPVTFVQTGSGTSSLTGGRSLSDTAVRDLRFGFAYALVPRVRLDPVEAADSGGMGRSWSLAARLGFSAPTGDSTDFAGERSAVFMPSIAADYRVSRLFFGADVGMRLRPTTEFAGARIGTQLTTALGAGFDIFDRERLSILAEGRAYWNFAEQHDALLSSTGVLKSTPNGRSITPAEWLVGVRSAPFLAGDVSFYVGGGGPIPLSDDTITTPRYRFVLGATYAPIARDTDHDGIPDKVDACPTEKGPRGGERPGCPPPPEGTQPPAPPPPPPPPALAAPPPAATLPAPAPPTPEPAPPRDAQ